MTKANYEMDEDFIEGANERANAHKRKSTDHLVMLNTRVPKDLRDRVKLASVMHDTSITAIVGEALEAWLAEHNSEKPKTDAFDSDGL